MVSLSHKALTVALCVFYFTVIEQIPIEQCLQQNGHTLAFIVGWAHLSSCFNLDFSPIYWQKLHSESKCGWLFRTGKVVFMFANLFLFVVVCAIWPLLSWLNYSCTQLDTDYYALRYFFQFVYFVSQNIPYSAVDNMQMLIGDGFFLIQIVSMLLYNTMSFKAMVFVMAPLLVFQNGKICFDILNFVKEPREKTTFVRLIGTHDSVYLVIMFTLLVSLMCVMDAFAFNWVFMSNLVYLPLVMYLFVKIMDTKQARLVNSFFPLIVLMFTALGIYIYLASHVVANNNISVESQRDFPLWEPKPEEPVFEGPVEDPDKPKTWSEAIWSRLTLGGVWFFLDWIVYPFWGWIVVPWYSWTLQPILSFLFACIYPILSFVMWIMQTMLSPVFNFDSGLTDEQRIEQGPSIDDL